MSFNKLPNWIKGLILSVLIIFVVLLVVFQINSVDTVTKLEATMFNILQFLFSIIFAWLLSLYVGESQFVESQRKFAIAAFRRIKEIERALRRTEIYLMHLEQSDDEIVKAKAITIKSGLLSIQDTVKSSIADWSDVIGDEIKIADEIKKLRKMRDDTEELNSSSQIDFINKKINKLEESLSSDIANHLEEDEEEMYNETISELISNYIENGNKIHFECFWEKNAGFSNEFLNLKIGDKLSLSRGMTESRTGALMLFKDEEQVAVVTNPCNSSNSYDMFVEAFEEIYGRTLLPKFFNGMPLTVKIVNIYDIKEDPDRQYFDIIVEDDPKIKGLD